MTRPPSPCRPSCPRPSATPHTTHTHAHMHTCTCPHTHTHTHPGLTCRLIILSSPPACSSSLAMSACPRSAADMRGVLPDAAGSCTAAWASTRSFTTSCCPAWLATLRAVHPSPSCGWVGGWGVCFGGQGGGVERVCKGLADGQRATWASRLALAGGCGAHPARGKCTPECACACTPHAAATHAQRTSHTGTHGHAAVLEGRHEKVLGVTQCGGLSPPAG